MFPFHFVFFLTLVPANTHKCPHTRTQLFPICISSCRAVAEVATANTPHTLARPNQLLSFFCLSYPIVPWFPYLRCRRRERSFSSSFSVSRVTTHSCRSRALVLETTQREIQRESSTIIITLFFYMEQYCLCGNISLVDFPNIKSLSFSLNKSSMAGERPSHRAGGLRYALCVWSVCD